jgi:hypothetical protein
MKNIFFLLLILLLPSCYPLHHSSNKINYPTVDSSEYLYFKNINSWVGRSIEELLKTWGEPLTMFFYGDTTPKPFKNLEKGQRMYLWMQTGIIAQSEQEIQACLQGMFFEIRSECEIKEYSCFTGTLVDDSGYITKMEPDGYSTGECIEGAKYGVLNFPKAP